MSAAPDIAKPGRLDEPVSLQAAPVFVSYSSRNRALADQVCAGMEERGIRCWMAPRDILPGREWSEAIIEGINGASVMLLVLSPASAASQQVRREIERAEAKSAALIALRVEPEARAPQLPGGESIGPEPHQGEPTGPEVVDVDVVSPPIAGTANLLVSHLRRAHHIEAVPLSEPSLEEAADMAHTLIATRRALAPAASQVLEAPQPIAQAPEAPLPAQAPEPSLASEVEAPAPRGWNWGAFFLTGRWASEHQVLRWPARTLASLLLYASVAAGVVWSFELPQVRGALLLSLLPRVFAGARGTSAAWQRLAPSERRSLGRALFVRQQRNWARRGLLFWAVVGAIIAGLVYTDQGGKIKDVARHEVEANIGAFPRDTPPK